MTTQTMVETQSQRPKPIRLEWEPKDLVVDYTPLKRRKGGRYKHSEAFDSGFLRVSDTHSLYYEQYGKYYGKPVLFLHGGPGAECTFPQTEFFDYSAYRVVFHDQRGSGKSTPSGELQENTTQHLIQDIETLRKHLKINKWHLVFGGSWGATLGLLYAQAYPTRVTSMVIRGVTLCRSTDLNWTRPPRGAGISRFFPEAYDRFLSILPPEDQEKPLQGYYKMLISSDHATRVKAAREWNTFDLSTYTLIFQASRLLKVEDEEWSVRHATLEAHYYINNIFCSEEQEILYPDNIAKINHIPITIIQGHYDMGCTPESAWILAKALGNSNMVWVKDAGHNANEPGIRTALLTACDEMAALPSQRAEDDDDDDDNEEKADNSTETPSASQDK